MPGQVIPIIGNNGQLLNNVHHVISENFDVCIHSEHNLVAPFLPPDHTGDGPSSWVGIFGCQSLCVTGGRFPTFTFTDNASYAHGGGAVHVVVTVLESEETREWPLPIVYDRAAIVAAKYWTTATGRPVVPTPLNQFGDHHYNCLDAIASLIEHSEHNPFTQDTLRFCVVHPDVTAGYLIATKSMLRTALDLSYAFLGMITQSPIPSAVGLR